MNELRKLFYLLLIIPILFIQTGCSDDDPADPPVVVNEAEVLVKYLEDNGNPVTTFAQMIKADVVNAAILANDAGQVVIDIRSAETYAAGHIKDAVNVSSKEVLTYYEANDLNSKDVVVIACYSGQSAAWVTGLMHTMGYTNVKDMKWGMCSWNATTSGSWTGTQVNNSRASQFVTAATAKPAAGDLPTLSTGETDGDAILRARVETVFAEGFGEAGIGSDDVYADLSGHFIANYWSEDHYNWGHIEGAMQYSPKDAFTLDQALTTLPTDKLVAVYCYTGQTSAHVAGYLRVLGYNAKSIKFGVNGMSHDTMPTAKFDAATQIHDYELVQ